MRDSELDSIIREYTPRLRQYVKSRVNSSEDAEDIVQDIFYQLMRTMRVLENPVGHVASWLFTVAHNMVINHEKRIREEVRDVLPTDELDADDPDSQLLRKMLWDELDKALAELPAAQRDAFTLTEIDGLSTEEVAVKMGVPVNTVLSRKHYAVKRIREKLGEFLEG